MWLLVSALLLVQAKSTAFGVAPISAAGDGCLAMPQVRLATGSIVTLVQPNQPQSVMTAVIEEPIASCKDLEAAMIDGPYYRLRGLSPAPEERSVWIAVPGRVVNAKTAAGQVSLRLSQQHNDVRIRSCTSSEGLHLTAWDGEPLESRRLWHQYYYLGYDVEPSCTEEDVGDANLAVAANAGIATTCSSGCLECCPHDRSATIILVEIRLAF
jgi:hypothetical protein